MTRRDNINDLLPGPPIGRVNVKVAADLPSADPRNASFSVLNLGETDERFGSNEIVGRSSQGKLVTLLNTVSITVTLGAVGLIQSYNPNAAGTGYAVNDTFSVGGAGTGAIGKVLAVGALGAVQSVQIISPGVNYVVATGVPTTPLAGGGSGLTIDIFSVEQDVFDGLMFWIKNIGTSFATLFPGSGYIDSGNPSLSLPPGTGVTMFWNGTNWRSEGGIGSAPTPPPSGGTTAAVVIELPLAPSAPGNFTVAHGLPAAPAFALIQMDSGGDIWFQPARYDATNLYLTASDAGVLGKVQCWMLASSQEIPYTSSIGNFSVAHGLGATPVLVQIQKTAAGGVWLQTPAADSTHIYLTGSAAGITGFIEVWKVLPIPISSNYARVALAPGAAGNFSVAHGLGAVPFLAEINMTSGGAIWFQSSRYDGTKLLLVASDAGVTGYADVWAAAPTFFPSINAVSGAIALTPVSPGNFTVAHGAGATPKAAVIEMSSGGAIWFQATAYDATNLYLVASDGGVTANAKVIT